MVLPSFMYLIKAARNDSNKDYKNHSNNWKQSDILDEEVILPLLLFLLVSSDRCACSGDLLLWLCSYFRLYRYCGIVLGIISSYYKYTRWVTQTVKAHNVSVSYWKPDPYLPSCSHFVKKWKKNSSTVGKVWMSSSFLLGTLWCFPHANSHAQKGNTSIYM